jgi:hypothetical protein
MAAINQPNRAPSQMDAISAVLNIGSTLYGIKANREKAIQDKQDSVLGNKVKEAQLLVANQDLADKAKKSKGEYTPNEIAALAVDKGYNVSNSPLGQAIKLTQITPDGKSQDVYLSKTVDQGKSLDLENKLLQNQKLTAELGKSKKDNAYGSLDSFTKKDISDMKSTNTKLLGIKNGIDAGLAKLTDPKISEDLKVKAGENMLKLLNSAEGSDAVGAEESKRLGGLLEYKLLNFKEPGSFIGRDLDLFTEQVSLKSQEFGDRIKLNEDSINRIRSGESLSSIASTSPKTKKEGSSLFSEAVASGSDKAPKFDPSKPFKVVK